MPLSASTVRRFSLALGICVFALSAGMADAKGRVRHPKAKPAAAAPAVDPVTTPQPVADSDVEAKAAADNPDGSVRSPIINDAPKGDYERVAWCHGILSGDMELAELIGPVEPVDNDIQAIGRSYLRAYEAALTLSGEGKTEAGHTLAEKARQSGYDGWAAARKAEIHKAAYAYNQWQLPADCEHAAVRLSGHPNLFAELATEEETTAINAALNSGGPHNYEELPKPKLTAQAAPVDADAPIATNTLSVRAKAASDLPVTQAPDSNAAPAPASNTVASAPVTASDTTQPPAPPKTTWSSGLMAAPWLGQEKKLR